MIKRPGGSQIRRFCVRPERPVVGSAEDEPDAGDTVLGRAALRGPVVSSAEDHPIVETLLLVKKFFTDLL